MAAVPKFCSVGVPQNTKNSIEFFEINLRTAPKCSKSVAKEGQKGSNKSYSKTFTDRVFQMYVARLIAGDIMMMLICLPFTMVVVPRTPHRFVSIP